MTVIREKGLVAKKVGMSRMLDEFGNMIPVTLLQVEDQKVTKILTPERDGYHGYQVGFFSKKEKNLTKSDVSRLRKSGIEENYAKFKEFRTLAPVEGFEVGTSVTASLFEGENNLDISGLTKGRGFQGSIKRWGYSIGRMTHGSRFHRRTGSLGMCTTPGRVMKGKKMPGHYGVERRTIKNLKLADLNTDANIIAIKGSVPGNRGSYLEIRPSNKK
jgi:large subunit ribosomal protein L3